MISSKPINHNKPWTVEDRENLTAMVVAQYDWVMISNILGRTLNATLVEFYRIANHPNKDEVELSRMIQPYKSCYDWKEGHKNPSEIVEELKPNNELKGLIGKKFFFKGAGAKTMLTIESVVITQSGNIYINTGGHSYFLLEDCDFIVEIVNLK